MNDESFEKLNCFLSDWAVSRACPNKNTREQYETVHVCSRAKSKFRKTFYGLDLLGAVTLILYRYWMALRFHTKFSLAFRSLLRLIFCLLFRRWYNLQQCDCSQMRPPCFCWAWRLLIKAPDSFACFDWEGIRGGSAISFTRKTRTEINHTWIVWAVFLFSWTSEHIFLIKTVTLFNCENRLKSRGLCTL